MGSREAFETSRKSEVTPDPGSNGISETISRSLDDPVQYLKGVGLLGAELLAKLGILTVWQLLRHIPRRWDDRTAFASADDVHTGDIISLYGKVVSVTTRRPKPRVSITEAVLNDNGSPLKLIWFNQPFMEKTFKALATAKKSVIVYGQIRRYGWTPEIQNPEWEEVSDEHDGLSTLRIVPVYPLTEGLTQTRLRKIMSFALEHYLPMCKECLPADILRQHKLIGSETANGQIHFPSSFADLDGAKRRLIFEEFFLMQATLALRRRALHVEITGPKFEFDLRKLNASMRKIVPFELTSAQSRTIAEISADVSSGETMNRLLQGDVGSGKTIVGLAAILMAVESGYQAALMVPTEILAQQHAIVLRRLLEPLGLSVELSIGSQPAKEKREIRRRIESGEARIAVGTHALIQDAVKFENLGMVIVDEQHRFGVLQRRALAQKGSSPHVLVMTATPIPRTLTISMYGDLDISALDELPPGRKPITTHWKTESQRLQVYTAAQRLLAQGRQAYIVCPLIEESEKLQAKSAVQFSEHIATDVFPQYRVGLLHGQLRSDEKDQVMSRFKAHELDILVATTVIEVGIDVPNASVIIIENADRFGLAQLHQLRGRVGRGEYASFCILIAEPKTDIGRARMEILTQTRDGFVIAEEDLRLRGPGEFYGTRQSGIPEFCIADIIRDSEVLMETRAAAFRTIELDPKLEKPENSGLRSALKRNSMGFELMTVS